MTSINQHASFRFAVCLALCSALVCLATNVCCAQTTIYITVSTGNDDGWEDSGGDPKLTDSTFELGSSPYVATRFQNVTIPSDSTITSAEVRFVSAAETDDNTISITIYGEDVDDSSAYSTSTNNISSRTKTTASASWSTGDWESGDTVYTSDLASLIQEIVDRPGWSSGNSITIIFDSNNTSRKQVARTRDYNSSNAPRLTVTYTRPPKVFYVRPDGNNSNTGEGSSSSEAWATVAYATTSSDLVPGDKIYVMPGTYTGQITPSVDGTSSAPISFVGDRDGAIFGTTGDVILQTTSGNEVIDMDDDDYLEFVGFKINASAGGSSQEAVELDNCDGIVLEQCEIYNADNDGVRVDNSSIDIINCLIYDNVDDGVHVGSGTVTIWNSTIAHHDSDAIYTTGGTTTITNSIIAFNVDDGIDDSGGSVTSTYNIVHGNSSNNYEGLSQGTGDSTSDPLFLNSASRDYRLQGGSPGIDTGIDPSGLFNDDLLGNSRPNGAGWDIGCYEGDTLLAHWKFDEGSGTTIADASIYGNDAAFNTGSPTWDSAVRENGLTFSGSNDATTDATFTPPSTGTVAFWMKVPGSPGTHGRIFGLGDTWEVRHVTSGTTDGIAYGLVFDLGVSGTNTEFATTITVDDANRWYHIAATYSSVDDSYEVYVNGDLHRSGTYSSALSVPSANTLSFGTRTSSSDYFTGSIDDLRVYNIKLSAAEIAELYGLVGHWKLDETSGTTAADSSGLGNDGTVSGTPNWSSDSVGNGVHDFDGSTHYISVASTSSLQITESITLAGWIKSDSWGAGADVDILIRKGEGNPNNYQLAIVDGRASLSLDSNDGSGYTGDTVLEIDRWYHVAATWDGSTVNVFVDGQLDATPQAVSTTLGTDDRAVYLGGRSGTDLTDGMQRDLRIYNRALSHAEIAELYGLVAWWKLDESSGITAYDSSGMDHHATLTGTQGWTSGSQDGGFDFNYADGDDYFEAPNNSTLDDLQESDYSVLAWFRPDTVPPGSGSDNDSSYGILMKSGWHSGLYYGNTGLMGMDHWLTGNVGSGVIDWLDPRSTNRFHHVAGVVSKTEGTVKIYVNGVLENTTNFAAGTDGRDYGTEPWRIGIAYPGASTYGYAADGIVDDARLYNRVLRPEEIEEIYDSTRLKAVRIIRWVEAQNP